MEKNKQAYMNEAEEALLHTYNRFQIVLDHGDGVYLYDLEGKKYLDFAAGIAVFALGYHYPGYDDAVKNQVDKLIHTSNLFYSVPVAEAAHKLKSVSGMDRVFFTNSGTEAMEGAIKSAKKYAWQKDGSHDHEIIAMKGSFHGRSIGALSVTGNDHYQEPFKPLLSGIKFAQYNDLDSVKALVNEKTCAIVLETLQGEGGIYVADPSFMQGLKEICEEQDILLILDEVQCGMGRTGSMFCYQNYGIRPDIVTVAKALGCGVPIGAFLCTEKAAVLTPGDHGTTYGGNPLVCAAASKVLDIFEQDHIVDHVKEVGAYLYEQLEKLTAETDKIIAHRGMGLMQGIEFNEAPGAIVKKAQDKGLIVITAENNVIRFVPPLVIEKQHVDEMIAILKECIE
ncbi:MAG: aspartate aminotransferase family protein [Clostridiales bacterium]|nr:aspartate aminotransferase family protein [Clostridiales bacterium]